MKQFEQDIFQVPPATDVEGEPLVIHRHKSDRDNQTLVIFVHGLGGRRYGSSPTWGDFPQYLFEDLPNIDIGLYEYTTLAKRLKFWKSISLDTEAEIFSQIIRDDLGDYQTVILIGHSMGGLLAKAVIAELIDSDHLARIGGLILMATPQLGSTRVPRFLGLSNDARALRVHGKFVSRITRVFEDKLYLDETISAPDRAVIPTWAVLGASDLWVDELSAGIGLPTGRKRIIRGSHTEIVKPKNKSSTSYVFVKEKIGACLNRYKYDVFLASPMAALDTDADYQRYRHAALAVEKALVECCDIKSVFYAGREITTKKAFEAAGDSLNEDFRALQASRYFMLVYPERRMSSVIYEAGMALAMGKPSIYLTNNRSDLPFLLQQAPQAFDRLKVKIYENCADTEDVVRVIRNNCGSLFLK